MPRFDDVSPGSIPLRASSLRPPAPETAWPGEVAAAGARMPLPAAQRASCAPEGEAPAAVLAAQRAAFEAHLSVSLPAARDAGDRVALAMREAVMSPGKRIRPLLLLAAGRSLGVERHALLDAACALEAVHAASLVLDDLPCMDDARLRRGRPTLHLQFGQDVAALAVVALVTHAYRLVASSPWLDAATRMQQVVVLADAVGHQGLVAGQMRDLHPDARPGIDGAEGVNDLKTGALFRAAFEMACIAARAEPARREALSECGAEIGRAFQLCDDLKDRGDAAAAGKDTRQDDGKPTLLSLIGEAAVHERLRGHALRMEAALREAFPHDGLVLAFLRQGGPWTPAAASRVSTPAVRAKPARPGVGTSAKTSTRRMA